MSFRRPVYVLTEAPGQYVEGVYQSGVRTPLVIDASVQPVSGEDMITAPEGRRIQDMIKVYTSTEIKQVEEGKNQQPDLILWRGHGYEVTSIDVRQMGVISHYKIFATRRLSVPSGSEWPEEELLDLIINTTIPSRGY